LTRFLQRVVTPKSDLSTLDLALAKLRAFEAAIDSINGRLAGLSTHSAFRRTREGIANTIKDFKKAQGKKVDGVALPNPSQGHRRLSPEPVRYRDPSAYPLCPRAQIRTHFLDFCAYR
jgi:hypothetical protein